MVPPFSVREKTSFLSRERALDLEWSIISLQSPLLAEISLIASSSA